MEVKELNINDLKPAEYNPRQSTAKQEQHLKESLEKFGVVEPVIVNMHKDREGIIVGGHFRVRELKKLGHKTVPCVMVELNLEDERELNVRLNKNTGEFDFDMLANNFEIEELKDWGFEDLELGIAEEEQEIVEDEAPEVQDDPATKKGDVWILGDHRLVCGDATNIDDVKKCIDDDKIDAIFTDPPYGINEKGDRSNRKGLVKGNKLHDFIDDSTKYAIDAFNLCCSMDIPIQVWWGANYYAESLPPSANWLVWDKRVEEKQRDMQSDCELAWAKSRFKSVRIFRHLWKGLIKGSEHGQKRVHPTQKPIALAKWTFQELEFGNIVLDLFGGSGITLIACEQLNRQCRMMELDEKYCDVIIKRWQNLTGQDAVLDSTKQTYNELKGE